jgi:hypothetical protein
MYMWGNVSKVTSCDSGLMGSRSFGLVKCSSVTDYTLRYCSSVLKEQRL